jgi:hypothetical protein
MPNTFTDKLTKQLPAAGDSNWEDEYYINERIDDVVMGALLSKNRVISGGVITHDVGLDVASTLMVIDVAGAVFRIAAATVTMTAASATPELVNWVYINDAGVLVSSTDRPTGDYIPLALVATNDTTVLRIADLRPFADAESEVENRLINPLKNINQRNFDGNWAGIAIGAYGYDMWRRGITALTIEQPIINTSIHAGKHTLSWDGGGDGDVTQSAASVGSGASPLTVTLADQIQAEVIVPEGATNLRFVEGDIERPVRCRDKEEEKPRCLPYCWRPEHNISILTGSSSTGWYFRTQLVFPLPMVSIPSVTIFGTFTYNSMTNAAFVLTGKSGTELQSNTTGANAAAKAELPCDNVNYVIFEAGLT